MGARGDGVETARPIGVIAPGEPLARQYALRPPADFSRNITYSGSPDRKRVDKANYHWDVTYPFCNAYIVSPTTRHIISGNPSDIYPHTNIDELFPPCCMERFKRYIQNGSVSSHPDICRGNRAQIKRTPGAPGVLFI